MFYVHFLYSLFLLFFIGIRESHSSICFILFFIAKKRTKKG